MMRITLITLIALCVQLLQAQQMHWSRLAEDTIYYANEYLPDRITLTPPGPGQIWDFRSLRAPYAISRRISISGDKENGSFGQLFNGKQPEATLKFNGHASQIVQVIEDNPVCRSRRLTFTMLPAKKTFFHGILGASQTYKGKMQAVFSWPRDINCQWTPAEMPDSCRITYLLEESIVVDGEGTLYMPTEVGAVYRQHVNEKRTLKVETKRGSTWRDVTSQVPGLQLIEYKELMRFVSSETGIMMADVEIKEDYNPIRVEFKTHPLVTRILSSEPSRPDIFAYPNPSFDIVRFRMSDLLYGKYKLKIFNILGVPVKEIEIDVDDPRKTISLDLGDLQRGTYLYRLQDAFGRTIKTKRVVLIQP
ncbi:MAG TPA: T9SS type A sorting domain-containing protein [Saprospiraceae bacterium]|nr:T9SS type A sorting domain-containing protein [Saprospiraceae bacterium]